MNEPDIKYVYPEDPASQQECPQVWTRPLVMISGDNNIYGCWDPTFSTFLYQFYL